MAALGTFLLSFLLSYAATVLLLKVPVRRRFADVPSERSSHDVVKPRFGGIAIVTSFFVVAAWLLAARSGTAGFLPLLGGGALIFLVGVLDDRRPVPVALRLAAQLAAALILVATGHVVDHVYIPLAGSIELDVLAVPFTILFVLTSINFFNFIDGIDGLAAGSAWLVSGFLALIAFMLGHADLALVCLAVSGASLGFLQFNFPPSRLFMGDGGSTFLGFFFAFAAIKGNLLTPELPFFVTILLLSSLYLDAGVTLLRRLFRGEKIFQPHRTHYYQRMLSLGFNHKQVTVLEYALTVLLGVSAVIFFRAGEFFTVFLCATWFVVFVSLMLKVRGLERGDRLFWEKRTVLVVASDVLLVGVVFYAAYFLRLGFETSGGHWEAVNKAFPIVLIVRSACFYWYGLYRGMWKYTSTPDIVKIIKSVSVGSAVILVLLVLFYRFEAFPRSMIIMEYFLLILGLTGTRFAARVFYEFGKDTAAGNPKRLAIVGAGDRGERALREIRAREGQRTAVVCFIDDDREKDGLTLQGIPITGPTEKLAEICERNAVDTLVVAFGDPGGERTRAVLREAAMAGIRVDASGGAADAGERAQAEAVTLDALSRGLGRRLPAEPSKTARKFYENRRVLLTNGGESLGPALARELVSLGARVAVHATSACERERFSGIGAGRVAFFAGALQTEADAARLLEAADPQVVFHAVPVSAEGVANEAAYLVERGARSCRALSTAMERARVESLVVLSFWGMVPADDRRALLSVLGEIMVLNDAALVRACPKVLRLPSVLSDAALRGAARGDPSFETDRFGLLEIEATAVALNAGAVCSGRMIAVPAAADWFGPGEIRGILSRSGAPPAAGDSQRSARPLFHSESPRPSVVPGADQVVSPVYPAEERIVQSAAACLRRTAPADLDECLAVLAAELSAGAESVGTKEH